MSIAVLVGVLPALETLVLGSLAPSTGTDHPAPKKTVLGAQYRGDSVRPRTPNAPIRRNGIGGVHGPPPYQKNSITAYFRGDNGRNIEKSEYYIIVEGKDEESSLKHHSQLVGCYILGQELLAPDCWNYKFMI